MKAFVLAAGEGTRLRPLTERVPKCLVPINGKPLLAYWIDLLARHGVDSILINTHHLHGQVREFFGRRALPVRAEIAHEPVLLGSAGTLRANRAFAEGEEAFFIVYADNLTDADLTGLLAAHRRSGQVATIGLFRAVRPRECGIATLDASGVVTRFEEKPARPESPWAFAGIAAASCGIFDFIPGGFPCDLGRDVLPKLAGRMAGHELKSYLLDVGTMESYVQAQSDAARIHL